MKSPEASGRQRKKMVVTTGIVIPIAALHFVTGPSYSGPLAEFVNGYLIDILLPFGVYFLLCPQDAVRPIFRLWYVKAVPVLAIGVVVEISQYFGIPIFGSTFDPWDFAAYVSGVGLAVIFDILIFPRIFSFWAAGIEIPEAEGS